MQRHELTLPNLGLGEEPIRLSLWLVRQGGRVREGQPVVEVQGASVVIDLASPADGVLAETFAEADDPLSLGQVLGVIVADDRSGY